MKKAGKITASAVTIFKHVMAKCSDYGVTPLKLTTTSAHIDRFVEFSKKQYHLEEVLQSDMPPIMIYILFAHYGKLREGMELAIAKFIGKEFFNTACELLWIATQSKESYINCFDGLTFEQILPHESALRMIRYDSLLLYISASGPFIRIYSGLVVLVLSHRAEISDVTMRFVLMAARSWLCLDIIRCIVLNRLMRFDNFDVGCILALNDPEMTTLLLDDYCKVGKQADISEIFVASLEMSS